MGSAGLQACNALPHGRPALAPIGGTTQEIPLTWDGLDKRLQPALDPLHLRVYIVERPDPDWIQAELLDLGGRSVSLRLRRIAPAPGAPDRVEVRCAAGRFGDPRLEQAVIDQLASLVP